MTGFRLLSILVLLLFFAPAFAQELMVEHYPQGTQLWLLVPYDSFIFGKDDTEISYQLSLEVKDEKGKQVARNERELLIPKKDYLLHAAIPLYYQFELAPGSYKISLVLLNSKLGDRRQFQRSISFNGKYTELGQVYLIAKRDGFEYIPQHIDLENTDEICLKHSFSVQADKIELNTGTQSIVFPEPQSPWETQLKGLMELEKGAPLKLAIWEKNVRYDLEPLLYGAWFAFSQRFQLKDQLAQIRYIATQNEFRELRKVPEARLAESIELFWQSRDPSPGTLRNEYREMIYARVLKAEELFTVHRRLRGWKSDQGRIYIKFGEPDEIVNDFFPIGRPPSIRWYYYRLNRVFLFTDDKGFGQYNLRNKNAEYEND